MKGMILLLVAVAAVIVVRLVASKPAQAAAKEETIEYIQFINQPEAADVDIKRNVEYSGDKQYYEHSSLKDEGPAQVPGSGIDESNTSDQGLKESPMEE